MNRKALIICHVPNPTIGTVKSMLEALNIEPVVHVACQGDVFPEDLSYYSGVVIMGGPMSLPKVVEEPCFLEEKAFVKRAIAEKIPVLGICLGAQLLAHIYGGHVCHGVDGMVFGFVPLDLHVENDDIFGDELKGSHVLSWHSDTYVLKQGQNLAGSQPYEQQAAKFDDHVYGVQFHPESTVERIQHIYNRDMGNGHSDLYKNVDFNRIKEDAELYLPQVHAWFKVFLHRLFLA